MAVPPGDVAADHPALLAVNLPLPSNALGLALAVTQLAIALAFITGVADWLGAVGLIALVVLWNLYRRSHPSERLLSVALGLAWGGAAGNLLDRLR